MYAQYIILVCQLSFVWSEIKDINLHFGKWSLFFADFMPMYVDQVWSYTAYTT